MRYRLFGKKCVSAVRILLAVAFTLTVTGQANAQVAGATLTGTIKDSSGAFIPNAQVDLPPNSAHFMIRHPDRSLARRW